MVKLLVIGLGGFVGAVVRYGLSAWAQRLHGRAFPIGTLTVNVLGCLVLGAAMAAIETRPQFSPNVRLFLTIGFLGAMTTFSTFAFETVQLTRDGRISHAILSVGANMLIGLGAVLLGRWAVKAAGLGG